MFKKQVKIQNSHSVANKDKKKLKEQLVALRYDVKAAEIFLDDKNYDNNELMMDKIQASKAVIYQRNKVPLMFTPDSKLGYYFPTIYLLFQLQEIGLMKCYLKAGVEQYIFNGADLMWPGIKAFDQESFKVNQLVVVYAKNQQQIGVENMEYFPIAVGKILANQIPDNLKGKAIQVEHYLYDELWEMGPKKIPDEIKIDKAAGLPDGSQEEETKQEEAKQSDTIQNSESNLQEESKGDVTEDNQTKQDQEENKGETPIQGDEEEGLLGSIPTEEMEPRIIEAFFRSIVEGIQDADIPMEPSDLTKDHMNLFSDINYKLDFKQTSWKRIGKFLEVMHKRGIIDYSEPKGVNHKIITKIHRLNEELKSYVPRFSLRKSKKPTVQNQNQDSQMNQQRVEINEVYQFSKHFNAVVMNVKEMDQTQKYFTLKDARDLISQYIKENDLEANAKKGCIKLDPILAQIIQNKRSIDSDSQIKKDEIFKCIQDHLIECYSVTLCDNNEITIRDRVKYHKGKIPQVKVHARRVHNKKQTLITGLELYQIDYEELCTYLQNKLACSVTHQDLEQTSKNPNQGVYIQGNHLDLVSSEILPKRYGVPAKYITKINDLGQKKGKK
ncbi:eukaryotic translation initiation factor 2d-like [Stylonychia lemnae]|uniref:Eukaryotic translation initiation factor 2d-like n=1 Tax=Stylonychia lemnae TaxID=5949 RepID=A0A078ACH6_STYLE|nr:eukaryotic translation initiation factor 2d-like [Stylonychia lemnae]|eukprot:CDW79297.1 eukaryotic translation initiation factor 2d-like [Stylonychia lemnae]